MLRILACLQERKVRVALLFILLVLLPISLLFTAWLIDFDWWNAEESDVRKKEDELMDDHRFNHLDFQLGNIRCPAKRGLGMQDYWDCLSKTSITTEGKEQHKRLLRESYQKQVQEEAEVVMSNRLNGPKLKGSTPERVERVRRELRPVNEIATDDSHPFLNWKIQKMYYITYDIYTVIIKKAVLVKLKCQSQILPGKSIRDFLECIQHTTLEDSKLRSLGLGSSYSRTFQPSTYPPMDGSEYGKEYPTLKMTDSTNNEEYKFLVEFKPLQNEEKLNNFVGADPYFEDNWSNYRFRFDNKNTKQRQVGWSYRGLRASPSWHTLNVERFYLPLKQNADLKKVELISDFAQTYPGIGEIAEELTHLQTPLDYSWTKDSGYNIYTRFLLPLLQNYDMTYYKLKGYVKPDVTLRPDPKVYKDISDGLKEFSKHSNDTIALEDDFQYGKANPKFPTVDTVPFNKAYTKFVGHFWGMNMAEYKNLIQAFWTFAAASGWPKFELLHRDFEAARLLLRLYVDAVNTQISCLSIMLGQLDRRVGSDEELDELVNMARDAPNSDCRVVEHESIDANLWNETYFITRANLKYLYKNFYERKDARQRYTLAKFPIQYPICKNTDPSPIDIQTSNTKQSSLRDYSFGKAAYRLNRFFMFFPYDGSTLLSVGIVDGQRLDDSSVRLYGGAVKGENLTFQYMHIRFSDNWRVVGSEHWINGKGAPMELQMVFTVSGSADHIKYWHVLARIQNQLFQFREKLVIILSVLVDVLETDDAVQKKIADENLKQDPYLFEPLAQAAYHFQRMPQVNPNFEQPRGYVSKDPVFRFIDFIPRKATKFYTYRGSLSWPPCFGYVIWSVYEQRLYISKRQFDQFPEIPAFGIEGGNNAGNNFRRFSDIHVEKEHDPNLNFEQVQQLIRERTVDRHILVGHHNVIEEATNEDEGVVGTEIYYMDDSNKSPQKITLDAQMLGMAWLLIFSH